MAASVLGFRTEGGMSTPIVNPNAFAVNPLHVPVPTLRRQWRVLVVDDELSSRQFVAAVLAEGGYATALAADGPDALTEFEKRGPFDLLLTDVVMPQMRRDELGRRMRRIQPMLKVLYLTGFSDSLFSAKPILWADE